MRFGVAFSLAIEASDACDMTEAEYVRLYGHPSVKIYIGSKNELPCRWRAWHSNPIDYARNFDDIKTLTEFLAFDMADVTYQLISGDIESRDRVTGPIWSGARTCKNILSNLALADREVENLSPSMLDGRYSKTYGLELLKSLTLKTSVPNPETHLLARLERSLRKIEQLANFGPLKWSRFKSRFQKVLTYLDQLYTLASFWLFFNDRDLVETHVSEERTNWLKSKCQIALRKEREKWSSAIRNIYSSYLEELFKTDEKENTPPPANLQHIQNRQLV